MTHATFFTANTIKEPPPNLTRVTTPEAREFWLIAIAGLLFVGAMVAFVTI